MYQHLIFRVYGRVQGVFYRQSTKSKADELKLAGLVRNEPDGSVYIEVEGTTTALILFREWCEQGPLLASVTHIEVSEGHWQNLKEFVIQR